MCCLSGFAIGTMIRFAVFRVRRRISFLLRSRLSHVNAAISAKRCPVYSPNRTKLLHSGSATASMRLISAIVNGRRLSWKLLRTVSTYSLGSSAMYPSRFASRNSALIALRSWFVVVAEAFYAT